MSEQVFGEQLLSICLEKVTKLLSDDAYFARRQAACLATVLYRKWTRPQASKLSFTQDIAWHAVTPEMLFIMLLLLLLPLLPPGGRQRGLSFAC